ncbi:hypothetical protein BC830DRAFT_737690 [Chytriomyces sp. MP71]|nr:hypothetical protein BC830DRAFT_737690 [Chytriomyces sp. MP71]
MQASANSHVLVPKWPSIAVRPYSNQVVVSPAHTLARHEYMSQNIWEKGFDPAGVITLFAGENAKGTLRQACLRHNYMWLDIGIHPGQLALAGHLLRCVKTPWTIDPSEQADSILSGLHNSPIVVKNLSDDVEFHVGGYFAGILDEKLRQQPVNPYAYIGDKDGDGTETTLIHLSINRSKHSEMRRNVEDPKLLNVPDRVESRISVLSNLDFRDEESHLTHIDSQLPYYNIMSSILNMGLLVFGLFWNTTGLSSDYTAVVVSTLHILSRLLIVAVVSQFKYQGLQLVHPKKSYTSVLHFAQAEEQRRIILVTAPYSSATKYVLGEDRFEKRNEMMVNVLALSAITMTTLASASFLLLFQFMDKYRQIIALLSMLFGWLADNRMSIKKEASGIQIDNLPADTRITAVSGRSRVKVVSAMYLTEVDDSVAANMLKLLPSASAGEMWANFHAAIEQERFRHWERPVTNTEALKKDFVLKESIRDAVNFVESREKWEMADRQIRMLSH